MKFVCTWVSKMKQLLAILVPIRHDDPSEGGRDVSVPESLVGRLPTVQSWESEDVIMGHQTQTHTYWERRRAWLKL